MNEQEALALAQQIETSFPGTVAYLDHTVFDHPETAEHQDYYTIWVSRERCEKWFYCKNVVSVGSVEQLDYLRKQFRIFTGKEM